MSGRRLILVAGQIGRSGVETFCQLAGTAMGAVAPTWASPGLFATISQDLGMVAADDDCWIPRRAAEALASVDRAFAQAGILETWMRSSAHLRERPIFIPVYGELPLPNEHPRSAWARAVRMALLDGSTSEAVLIGRVGSHITPVHLDLLHDDADGLIILHRHPVELFLGLIESRSHGMRPSEAVAALVHQQEQLERVARLHHSTKWLRYEDLSDDTMRRALGISGLELAANPFKPSPTRVDIRSIDSTHRAAIRLLATLNAEHADR